MGVGSELHVNSSGPVHRVVSVKAFHRTLGPYSPMIPQCKEMLTEIESSEIVVTPNGDSEPLGNMCSISMTNSQAASLTPEDVVRFIYQAARAFDRLRQSRCPKHSMIFYCWIDEQAGQLRLSVVSSLPLPFRCTTRTTHDASAIARQLLTFRTLEGIPFSDTEAVRAKNLANDSGNAPNTLALDVFTCNLPMASDASA